MFVPMVYNCNPNYLKIFVCIASRCLRNIYHWANCCVTILCYLCILNEPSGII